MILSPASMSSFPSSSSTSSLNSSSVNGFITKLQVLDPMVQSPSPPRDVPFCPASSASDIGIRAGSGLSRTSERSMLEMEANRVRDKEELKSLSHSLYGEFPQPSPSTETMLTTCSTNGPRVGSLLPTPLSIPLMNRAYDDSFNPSYSRPKPDLPNFTGKEVHGWLQRAEQFMDFYNISNDLRVKMAALYLEEGPLEWYRGNVRAKGKPLSWGEFEKGLVSMYDNSKAHKLLNRIPQPLPPLIWQLRDTIPQSITAVGSTPPTLAPTKVERAASPFQLVPSNEDFKEDRCMNIMQCPKGDSAGNASKVFDRMPAPTSATTVTSTMPASTSPLLKSSIAPDSLIKGQSTAGSTPNPKSMAAIRIPQLQNTFNSVTKDSDCYCTTNLCEGYRSTMVSQLARNYLSKLDYLQCPPSARRNAPTQLVPSSEALQKPSPPTGYTHYYPTSVAPVLPTPGSDSPQEIVNAPRESLLSSTIDLVKALNRTKRVGSDGLPTSLSTDSVPDSPRLETTSLFGSMSSFRSIEERCDISIGIVSRFPTPNLNLHSHNTGALLRVPAECLSIFFTIVLAEPMEIHHHVYKYGLSDNVFVLAALVDMCVRYWTIRDTYKVLDEISQRDMVLWLCGYAQSGQWNEALDLFGEMIETLFGCTTANVGSPDHKLAEKTSKLFVPTTMLVAFLICLGWVISRKAHLHPRSWSPKARMMLEEMCGSGFTLVSCMNVDQMIIARGTSGFADADLVNIANLMATMDEAKAVSMVDLEDALQVFEMSGRSASRWIAMIDRRVIHGYGELTPKMFQERERLLLVPDDTTFIRILNARNHSGLLQEGLMCFKAMKMDHQLKLKIQHYGCIVDILGRAENLEEAWKLMRGMPNVLFLPRSAEYGEVRMKDACAEVAERAITIKLTGISLYFKMADDSLKSYKGELSENEYLINLIDSPGHVDFSSEITAALCIIGGALLVVDCIIRAYVQTETIHHQALGERIRPVLKVNKIDRYFLKLQVEGPSWIHFNEPTLLDLNSHKLEAFTKASSALESFRSSMNVLIVSYFADIPAEAYKTLADLSGISGFGFVCVNGYRTIALIEGIQPRGLG